MTVISVYESYKNNQNTLLFILDSVRNRFRMRSYLSQEYQKSCLNETAATQIYSNCSWVARQQCNYLTNMNYQLVNQINDCQTQKYFYRNKLNHEYRSHTTELEEAFRIISQKNNAILMIEEQLDKLKKQYRTLEGDYQLIKKNSQSDKRMYQLELANTIRKCEQKIKAIQQKLEKQYELKLNKRITEVEQQCEDRIKMYKRQIDQLVENSDQLTHQLKLMQDKYKEMLLKNDLTIQETINRELRKRDFQAQNNYLRDVNQYESVLKDKTQLKQQLEATLKKNNIYAQQKKQLQALLQAEKTKYADLAEALSFEKQQNKIQIQNSFVEKREITTNTEQPFVPVVMPVDMDLMSEIVSLKEFVVEKIVERFLQFFCRVAVTDPKKRSNSLITFKNSMEQLKQANPQNKILLYIQTALDKIIKTYCPAMTYSRQYLTIKDQFIKRTLMQCETIENPTQKLYRILQLIHRLRHPITHQKSEISAGQLRMVEIKLMMALKKVFHN